MKIFAPNQMILAVAKIAKEHPTAGELQVNISQESLRELVLRIDQKEPGELRTVSRTITRRQAQALCAYLPTNAYHVDLRKITAVIGYRFHQGCFRTLFYKWMEFPYSKECLALLGKFDTEEYRPGEFSLKIGLLKKWSGASEPLSAVAQTANDLGQGDIYHQRFGDIGLISGSNLEKICYWIFLSKAKGNQLLGETDQRIHANIQSLSIEKQIAVLVRILLAGRVSNSFLTKFPRCYQLAYAIWKEPNSQTFKPAELFQTYAWWYNFYQLAEAMHGDSRRINFWKTYLDKCQCSRYSSHEMLIMRFKKHVVTEFENIGAVYIFTSQNFDAEVVPQMRAKKTAELKSWLYHYAHPLDRQTHHANWELNQTVSLRYYGVV